MEYEHIWVLLVFSCIFWWLIISVLAKYLQSRSRLKLREMVHKERMTALEKGVPLPELPEEDPPHLKDEKSWVSQIFGNFMENGYIGKLALGLGLILLFGGIGFTIAFSSLPDDIEFLDWFGMEGGGGWLLGIIPIMIGIGLLIYYRLIKNSKDSKNSK